MKIILAKEAGFCFGVRRASDMVLEHGHKENKINTLGPLIHNKQFIKYLEARDIFSVDDTKNIETKRVAIRSHGIPKETEKVLNSKNLDIIDATCPFVKRVHELAESLESEGYKVLIFGKKNHPEVIGIKSYAKKSVIVKDIPSIPKFKKEEKIALISQTTQNLELFERLSKYLKDNYKYVRIMNTICDATEKRQVSARELASKVDIMIIIGGKHSSNTSRLFDVCQGIVKSYHIEEDSEPREEWFRNVEKVGVTAGASTPSFIIKKIITKIKNYG